MVLIYNKSSPRKEVIGTMRTTCTVYISGKGMKYA
jgi:hypothetical protein